MKKAFSENLIFVDTEFTSLNPYKGEILSVGLVKMNGEELYLELEYDGEIDEWPQKHVVPYLVGEKVKKGEAIKKIKKFVGKKRPRMVACVNNFDVVYLCKLMGIDVFNEIFNWVPVDFASILFAYGVNPESLADRGLGNDFLKELKIDPTKYNQHNALDDARFLREVYLKFFEKN